MKIFFKIVLKYESFSKEKNNKFQLFKLKNKRENSIKL